MVADTEVADITEAVASEEEAMVHILTVVFIPVDIGMGIGIHSVGYGAHQGPL